VVQVTRGEYVRIINAGADAGRARAPISACPYGKGDPRQSWWVRGYAKGRTDLTDEAN
jgi:ribosome modulation factor